MGRGVLAQHPDCTLSRIQPLGHQGDKARHAIMTKLNQTFIMLFDHEDIHRLAFLQMPEMDCAHQNDKLDQPPSSC
jgi:uncharacterized protein Yka (UPF0111/DUF47 family)